VDPVLMRHASLRLKRRAQRALAREHGFSLIEVVIAAVIFLLVATALTGVMTSAIVSHSVSRERTKAVQLAQVQLERISELDYGDVGVSGMYPDGTIPAAGWNVPAGYAVAIEVGYINDGGPTAATPYGNYKVVTVTVTRTKDGKELTKQSTYVSPPSRPEYGGANSSNLTVIVSDYGTNSPLPGATVNLANGPAGNVSLVTNSSGQSPFIALVPTTTSPPTDYYDITVAKTGYETFATDLPPSSFAHITLDPGVPQSTTIRVFKRATINVTLKDASNAPYTGAATMKVRAEATGIWTTFTTTNGTFASMNSLGGNPVLPNDQYTVRVYTSTGLCSGDVQKNVPDNYPTTLTTTYDLQLTTCPSGTVRVNTKQLGANVTGATVGLTGGPNNINISGTSDTNGDIVFTNVPSHATDNYTITTTRTVQATPYSQTGTTLVSTGGTANVNLVLPSPALATVNATVNAAGLGQSGASVVLSGSPFGLANLSATTNGSGVATFTNVPIGTGYTATASLSPYANAGTTFSVVAPTTNTTVTLLAPTLTVNTSWAGLPAGSASVSVTNGTNTWTGTTNPITGVAAITVTPGTYNVTVTKNGFTGTGSIVVPIGGSSVNINNFPIGTITVTANWAGKFAGSANVSITGGPNGGTYTGTTAAGTGIAPAITVPTTNATYPYTVAVTKTTATGTGTGSTNVTTVGPVTVNLSPTKTFTITIQRGGSTTGVSGTSINLSITGGPNGTAGAAPAYTFTVVAGSGGVLPAVTVPLGTSGTTYTIKANLTTCGASASNRSGSLAAQANTGANTGVTVNMTTTACPFSPLP
jgi:prepilin-type N-terminal cleavage/methylation domain-containing protein